MVVSHRLFLFNARTPIEYNSRVLATRSSKCARKALSAGCLLVLFTAAAFAQKELSPGDLLLQPNDPCYEDAVKFAKVLNRSGVHVTKIFRSKLNGFFQGVERAALYPTIGGGIEVIFFPDSGAENIKVTEKRDGPRHVYSFTGQPHPNPPGDTFNSSQPMYFLAHENAFIVIMGDKKLFETLKARWNRN
jgi:hypothetical protein